jgi:hypothetical protein
MKPIKVNNPRYSKPAIDQIEKRIAKKIKSLESKGKKVVSVTHNTIGDFLQEPFPISQTGFRYLKSQEGSYLMPEDPTEFVGYTTTTEGGEVFFTFLYLPGDPERRAKGEIVNITFNITKSKTKVVNTFKHWVGAWFCERNVRPIVWPEGSESPNSREDLLAN